MQPLLAAALLAACGGRGATSPPAPAGPPAGTNPFQAAPGAALATAAAQALVGTWTSASCGERAWARVLTLSADGTWQGQDRVSPCPPDATCMWSGIVEHRGTWQATELAGAVRLQIDQSQPSQAPGGGLPPTSLRRQDGQVQDDQGCAYTEGPPSP